MIRVIPAILNISGDVAVTVLGAVVIALVTAVVTAVTTSKRLDKQLAHDRELKDVEELRSLLDAAAELSSDALGLSSKAILLARHQERLSGEQVKNDYRETIHEMIQIEQRIALRLGLDHKVTQGYYRTTDLAGAVMDRLKDFPLSEEQGEEAFEAATSLEEASDHFVESSRRYVGSQLRGD
jgi:hypothetical protein